MKEGKEQKRKSQKTYEREAARKKGQKTEWKDSKNERKTASKKIVVNYIQYE